MGLVNELESQNLLMIFLVPVEVFELYIYIQSDSAIFAKDAQTWRVVAKKRPAMDQILLGIRIRVNGRRGRLCESSFGPSQ